MRRIKALTVFCILLAVGCVPKHEPVLELKSGAEIEFKLSLPAGYELNPEAPSLVKVFRKDGNRELLLNLYNRDTLRAEPVRLGQFPDAGFYRLEGVFYYCEKKDSKVCLMKKASQLWELKPTATSISVSIDLN